jgi:hypothetical protein
LQSCHLRQVDTKTILVIDNVNISKYMPAMLQGHAFMVIKIRRHMAVDIDLPKHFERKMRDDLSASASNINLRDYSHYFFEVGLSLAMAKGDNDLRIVLTKAFAGDRFEALMVQALSR